MSNQGELVNQPGAEGGPVGSDYATGGTRTGEGGEPALRSSEARPKKVAFAGGETASLAVIESEPSLSTLGVWCLAVQMLTAG